MRLGLVAALGTSLALSMPDIPHAQQRAKKEEAIKVTDVTTSGNVVSISADGSLGRAQTWQDPEGFHVVLPEGQADASIRGAKVRRVGNSLELVVPVRRGANVTVQPRGNRLDLVVSGGVGEALRVENFPTESQAESAPKSRAKAEESREQAASPDESRAAQSSQRRRGASDAAQTEAAQPASQPQKSATAPTESVAPQDAQPEQPQPVVAANPPAAQPVAAAQLASGEGFDFFSLPLLLTLLGVALAGALAFLLSQRRKVSSEETEGFEVEETKVRKGKRAADESIKPFQKDSGDRRKSSVAVPFERRTTGPGALDGASREHRLDVNGASRNGAQSDHVVESASAFVPAEFGPYRIDQEVARLVQGKSHNVEIIASRSSNDRRAVETSLLKSLRAQETDEDGRRRARTALEDYGFVARSCAALLLGAESFERASAARTLGEMKSAHALPFLVEALYDSDPVVRMECVQGLGALGMPSAIGALLDVASRHPDLSASVLGPVLTACSVESLELSFDALGESRTFSENGTDVGSGDFFEGEYRTLGRASEFEHLPEWIEDDMLQGALEKLTSEEVETRVISAQHLAQFQVRRAVEALSAMALHDPEPAVRSAAVTSLGIIDHESVFVHVAVALADEAREVRAAAARAVSRLSFDRADAYVRVIESTDEQTLHDVAQACVKAGLAAQAISRLASEDRRQAYEAYSLLSLIAKAGETEPIFDTIECNRDIEVRLTCVRLLDLESNPHLSERLKRIGENGGVPEKVRRTIKETVERVEQLQSVATQ
jgi:HEAT repeat protein